MVVALAISSVATACIVAGYLFSTTILEHSGESLAANALAAQRLEQTRAAKWDLSQFPPVDELVATNFPPQVAVLDIPRTGNNVTYATNFTQLSVVSINPPVKAIQVDCVWRFMDRGLRTNTIVSYRRPD